MLNTESSILTRNVTFHIYSTYARVSVGICRTSHRPDECGTRPCLRWVQTQGCRSDTPGEHKKMPQALSRSVQSPKDWYRDFQTKNILVALLRSSSSKVQVPKFDYVACSSVRLSNHTRRKAIHNVSAHQLARYYLSQRVPQHGLMFFSPLIYTPQSRTYYQNIAKLLTHPSMYISVFQKDFSFTEVLNEGKCQKREITKGDNSQAWLSHSN